MNKRNKIVVLAMFFILIIAIVSFKQVKSEETNGQAKSLLARYGLEINRKEEIRENRLPGKGSYRLNIYNAASNLSGLNLKKYAGQKVKSVTYSVHEKSQPMDAKELKAVVIYKNNSVIGAYLKVFREVCGVTSLNENLPPRPEKLDPCKLQFRNVNDVEINDINNGFGNSKIKILDGNLMKKFLNVLEDSTVHNIGLAVDKNGNGKEINVCYKDGSYVKITYYKNVNKFVINNVDNWYYEPKCDISKLICN
ncbi:DUF4830 domain-containing protein [Clostridium felsineum]|uniref:Uncharacterized protein n=1 Tax=Clostridium felsineum TaxID=36839 RepID=A0A1S8LF33_9CLOT|nr:DUF4830 domain-containing protein [Clostridium felsineum]MCR3760920.1 DUF4830 domain-containing protein [Clostridium felsineum]URZ04391.1 hypothetical protein CLAUR_044800 [Clostridium felsineum]URZ07396.1 hypothetical protein CLROS_027340 [Clostridium felsineum]URZ12427.1 hypothetical protein CROST_031490 [Clostridium felsineum]